MTKTERILSDSQLNYEANEEKFLTDYQYDYYGNDITPIIHHCAYCDCLISDEDYIACNTCTEIVVNGWPCGSCGQNLQPTPQGLFCGNC
jgi:hypothetical protein